MSDLPRFVPVTPSPREWRVGDVIETLNDVRLFLARHYAAKEWNVLLQDGSCERHDAGHSPAAWYTNLGPHRIEPDGNGGLRFVKVERAEEEGWVRLGDCVAGDAVQFWSGLRGQVFSVKSAGVSVVTEDKQGVLFGHSDKVRVIGRIEWPKQESK